MAMSALFERDSAHLGECGPDSEPFETSVLPLEWIVLMVGIGVFLALQVIMRALSKDKRQEAAKPTAVKKYQHMQQAEEGDDKDDDEDENCEDDDDEEDKDYEDDENYEDNEDYEFDEDDEDSEDENEEREEEDDDDDSTDDEDFENEDDEEDDSEGGAEAAGAYFPDDAVLQAKIEHMLAYFSRNLVIPQSPELFTEEATEFKYKNSSGESEATEGEEEKVEENEDGELEEGPSMDLDSAEDSLP